MKITLKQWLTLETKATEARKALQELGSLATNMGMDYHKTGDERECKLLFEIHDRANDASGALCASLFHVQSEWTGGDSSNPKNSTLREPNIVGISNSFPKEQVDEFRNSDGEIVIRSKK